MGFNRPLGWFVFIFTSFVMVSRFPRCSVGFLIVFVWFSDRLVRLSYSFKSPLFVSWVSCWPVVFLLGFVGFYGGVRFS